MMTIQRILCAVEMRLEDINVLACACMIARPFQAHVNTLLVREGYGPPSPRSLRLARTQEPDTGHEAELLFAELLASTPGSPEPDSVGGGEPRVILERSEQCAADLIVLGLRRLAEVGPERVVALADELSRRAPCPVMTVPATAQAASISRVLLPVDFSSATERAIEWSIALAQRFSATVHVLHAVGSSALRGAQGRSGEPMQATLERARGRLEEIEQRLRAATVRCESSLVERGTTHAILACREQLDSSLIVMGVHRHGVEHAPTSGMVATVRCRAPVPVLSMTTPHAADSLLVDAPVAMAMGSMQRHAMSAGAPVRS